MMDARGYLEDILRSMWRIYGGVYEGYIVEYMKDIYE